MIGQLLWAAEIASSVTNAAAGSSVNNGLLMDTIITELMKTGGPLAVLVAVVYIFLKYMASEAEKTREAFQTIHKESAEARSQTREAIRDNAQATKENSAALAQLTAAVGGCPMRREH